MRYKKNEKEMKIAIFCNTMCFIWQAIIELFFFSIWRGNQSRLIQRILYYRSIRVHSVCRWFGHLHVRLDVRILDRLLVWVLWLIWWMTVFDYMMSLSYAPLYYYRTLWGHSFYTAFSYYIVLFILRLSWYNIYVF